MPAVVVVAIASIGHRVKGPVEVADWPYLRMS
jgi:hypothetical protein